MNMRIHAVYSESYTDRLKDSEPQFYRYADSVALSRQSLIYRRDFTDNGEQVSGFPLEYDLGPPSVPYSLDKKRRWELPTILRINLELEKIRQSRNVESFDILPGQKLKVLPWCLGAFQDFSEELSLRDIEIHVVESHKTTRQARCVSFISSRTGPSGESCDIFHRRFYFDDASITPFPAGTESSTKEISEKDYEIPRDVVRFDVLRPCPPTSAVCHFPKLVDNDISKPCHLSCIVRPRARNHRKRDLRLRRILYHDIQQDLESAIGDQLCHTADIQESQKKIPLTLGEFLIQEKPRKERIRKRKRRKALTDITSHINDDTKLEDDNTEVLTKPSEAQPIYFKGCRDGASRRIFPNTESPVANVYLSKNAITPVKLETRFGRSYIECKSYPRRFIIDISDWVCKRHKIGSEGNTGSFFVVFRNNSVQPVPRTDLESNSITLKTDLTPTLKHENPKDFGKLHIQDVFRIIKERLDDLYPAQTMVITNASASNEVVVKVKPYRSSIEKIAKWSSTAYLPTRQTFIDHFLGRNAKTAKETAGEHVKVSKVSGNVTRESLPQTATTGKLCLICCFRINEKNQGTALRTCGHVFCDNCWGLYLETSEQLVGIQEISCPEYGCRTIVDPGTMISLSSIDVFHRYVEHFHEGRVHKSRTLRWCPSTRCGRVVQVNSSDVPSATCDCGETFCFHCSSQPHFPAPCQVALNYQKRVLLNGDIIEGPVERVDRDKMKRADGKTCPHCKKFIEKVKGSRYIVCLCGRSFCWACGEAYIGLDHKCSQLGGEDGHVQKHVLARTSLTGRNINRWYRKAIYHRSQRHPDSIEKMTRMVRGNTERLRRYISEKKRKGQNVILKFEKLSENSLKLKQFLIDTIMLYKGVRELLENICVLLDSFTIHPTAQLRLQQVESSLSTLSASGVDLFSNEQTAEYMIMKIDDFRSHAVRNIKRVLRIIGQYKITPNNTQNGDNSVSSSLEMAPEMNDTSEKSNANIEAREEQKPIVVSSMVQPNRETIQRACKYLTMNPYAPRRQSMSFTEAFSKRRGLFYILHKFKEEGMEAHITDGNLYVDGELYSGSIPKPPGPFKP